MPLKILVVDDNADMRRVLARALAPLAQVTTASGGAEALRVLGPLKPRLLLLDVAMPEVDGVAVLKAAHAADPALPIVMLTAESDLEVAKMTLELGARSYITKPFDLEVVYDEASRLLTGAAAHEDEAPYRPWRVTT